MITPYSTDNIVAVLDSQRTPPAVGRLAKGVYYFNDKTGKYELLEPLLNIKKTTSLKTEVDFGSVGISSQTFTVDALCTTSSVMVAQVANEKPAGKDLDEIDMDSFDVKVRPDNGKFHLTISTTDGSYLADRFIISTIWQ